MPYSSNNGKIYVRRFFERCISQLKKPIRVLDIGAGAGQYSTEFRSLLPSSHWIAIEIWQPYIDQFQLNEKYDTVINQDIRSIDFKDEHFDVVILGDVLEHMTAKESHLVWKKLQAISDYQIISIPIGYYPQDEWEGNPYEEHVVDNWTIEEILNNFSNIAYHAIDQEIGVFIGTKHKKLKPSILNSMSPKFAIYTIAKNEEQFAKRWADSCKEADYRIVLDTGSIDNTVDILQKLGVIVNTAIIRPWRFDKAREVCLQLIPGDADICITMDMDEILMPGWKEAIIEKWTPYVTRVRYHYTWSWKSEGVPDVTFMGDRSHARFNYTWRYSCHETVFPINPELELYIDCPDFKIQHHPDNTKSRGQYMPLLAETVKEFPTHDRPAFYYGRELFFYNKIEEAIEELKRYLGLPAATWNVEKSQAMILIAQCYRKLNNSKEAVAWCYKSVAECDSRRETWYELAWQTYLNNQWIECYAAATKCLEIKNSDGSYLTESKVWGAEPWDLLALSCHNLGFLDKAVEAGIQACKLSPDDKRLKNNLHYYEESLKNKTTH